MLATNIDSFKILEFFPYPSFVQYEITFWDEFEKRGDWSIKKLFENILKRANEITGETLSDNKIAFKIIHIPTETTLYIGYKDGKYSVGMDVWSETSSKKRIIGVIKKSKTIDYLEVKGVDLEKEIDKWIDDTAITHEDCSISDVISTAKHFFELGLKTQKGGEK